MALADSGSDYCDIHLGGHDFANLGAAKCLGNEKHLFPVNPLTTEARQPWMINWMLSGNPAATWPTTSPLSSLAMDRRWDAPSIR